MAVNSLYSPDVQLDIFLPQPLEYLGTQADITIPGWLEPLVLELVVSKLSSRILIQNIGLGLRGELTTLSPQHKNY